MSFGATDVVEIANALGIELHRWYSERHGVPATLTAQLQFDEQQRVASLSSLTADGRPFLVDGALVETLNTIANPLQTAPDNFHMTRLGVDIAGGQLNTRIGYRHDEPPAADAPPTAEPASAPTEPGTHTDDFVALLAGRPAADSDAGAPPPVGAVPSPVDAAPATAAPPAPQAESAGAPPWGAPMSFDEPPIPPIWDPLPDYPAPVGEQPAEAPQDAPPAQAAEPSMAPPYFDIASAPPVEEAAPRPWTPQSWVSEPVDEQPQPPATGTWTPDEWGPEHEALNDVTSVPVVTAADDHASSGSVPFGVEPAVESAPSVDSATRPPAAQAPAQRPLLVFDELEVGPHDLAGQLPLEGELLYPIPGPDRPDYCLVLLRRPLTFRLPADVDPSRFAPEFLSHLPDGGVVATVPLLVIAARYQGTQIAPDLKDLWVNVAYVTDNSVAQDAQLDFSKVHYAAIARINLG